MRINDANDGRYATLRDRDRDGTETPRRDGAARRRFPTDASHSNSCTDPTWVGGASVSASNTVYTYIYMSTPRREIYPRFFRFPLLDLVLLILSNHDPSITPHLDNTVVGRSDD